MQSPESPSTRVSSTRRRISRRWLLVGALVAAVALTLSFGLQPRLQARENLAKDAATRSTMVVSVIRAKQTDATREIVLPGNMRAYSDTPIYARTSGYLKRWYVDIGKRVKAGDLLAEIDTPEIDDQLQQARADLANAEAEYRLAESTNTRWEALLKTDSVSKQEVEERRGAFASRKAAVEAARFNVARLQKLQSFKRLTAPFDGVITARNTDIGALVDAGSSTPSRELFHLASTQRMRVYVNVPQAYAAEAVPGVEAELTLAEYPGRRFKGSLVRNTQAIDTASRTLLAEVEVPNPTGELLPGAYAEVHLKLGVSNRALLLPVNALLFRPEGVMVALVKQERTELVKIALGRDFGTEVEVVSGLAPTDDIVINPSDSLISGVSVRVVKDEAAPPKAKS
ncbi:MAG: efflux RND transporter periplasmic adaptor subunit [Burkholderiales bacterium]|nr:efflux RND transporter periplasmic adaptor subunit [Burkholderiales bacterium]